MRLGKGARVGCVCAAARAAGPLEVEQAGRIGDAGGAGVGHAPRTAGEDAAGKRGRAMGREQVEGGRERKVGFFVVFPFCYFLFLFIHIQI
jgi:hypothetical protein